MTDTELDAIAEAATPGSWSYVRNPEGTRWIIDSASAHAIACTAGFEPDNEANARHIATFDPPTIIALLDRIATLEADNARLREALGYCESILLITRQNYETGGVIAKMMDLALGRAALAAQPKPTKGGER